jgi:maleylacetoacetate isomerase/maleylpyruvate isomerase
MIFHGYFRSSAAWRCRIAFNLKSVAPDETYFVHLRRGGGEQRQPAYRAINPQGLVPALAVAEGVLTQSLAIIEWLDETQSGPRLLPEDPFLRARVRGFAQTIACDVHPLHNLRVLDYLGQHFDQDQAGKDAWCRHWIGTGLEACETLALPDSQFCFGEQPGLADICLVPQMASAARFGLDTSHLPRLTAITARCNGLDAFALAAPSRQPDFED